MGAIPREYNAAVDLIDRNLKAGRGGKVAYIDDTGNHTYAELAERVNRAANALVALGVTVLGLGAVNVSDALQSVLVDKGTGLYWAQTVAIAAYEVWLVALYHKQK